MKCLRCNNELEGTELDPDILGNYDSICEDCEKLLDGLEKVGENDIYQEDYHINNTFSQDEFKRLGEDIYYQGYDDDWEEY